MTSRGPARTAAGSAGLVAAAGDAAWGDRVPTQPVPAGRRGGLVLDDRHARAPEATSRRPWSAVRPLLAAAVVLAAILGAVGYPSWAASSVAPDAPVRSAPAPSPSPDVRHGDHEGVRGEADGAVPDGVTVFDDDVPAVAGLDAGLLDALRRAATEAADDSVKLHVNSGWRSRAYQDQLLREAVSRYGSEEAAARWVATADTSPHVSGDAVDIGHADATAWLSEHGARYGLCPVYRNEPWHYELRPDAVDDGCPPLYADPTHDPRMQQ